MPNQYTIFEFIEAFKEAYKTIDVRATLIKQEDQWRIVCMALRIRIAPEEIILQDYQRETNDRKIDSQNFKIIQSCLPFDDLRRLLNDLSKGELILNGLKVILDAPKDLSKISGYLQFFTRSDGKPSVIDWPVLISSVALTGTNPYYTVLQTDSAINRYVETAGYDNVNSAIKNLLGKYYESSMICLTIDLDVPARIDNIVADRTGHNVILFKVNVTAHQALSDLQCNIFKYKSSQDKELMEQLTLKAVSITNGLQSWAGEFNFKGSVAESETVYFDLIHKDIGRLHWQEYRSRDIKVMSDVLAARTGVKAVPSTDFNIQAKVSEIDPKTNDNDLKQYAESRVNVAKGARMEIREDFISVKDQLLRLVKYAEVFEENNFEHWPHLKNKEDFQSIYSLSREVGTPLENIYSVGRDCSVSMSEGLRSFNNARDHPTLTSFIESFDRGWVYQIGDLRIISANAKKIINSLRQRPWAVEQMIILFDEQLKLLAATRATLKLLKQTDLYKSENPNFFYNLFQPVKKAWKDPVWSKVIATAIILFISAVWSYFHWFSTDKFAGNTGPTGEQALPINRIITLKQKSKIVDTLLTSRGSISIAYVRGDRKAEQYAQEIRDIFNTAYWHTSIAGANFAGFDGGLIVSANKMSDRLNIIITAFQAGDINIKPLIDPNMKEKELELKVGSP